MQQGELGQNPALNSIQWDPAPLHCLWHCQRMHTCCYALYQSAQSLGQKGRNAEAGTAWILSFCSPVRAPCCSCPFPVLHWCCSAAQRAGGWWAPAPCYMVLKVTGKEILLYQEQERKGADTLSKTGRESGVWTSALDSV